MRLYFEVARRALQRQFAYRTENLAGLFTNVFFGYLLWMARRASRTDGRRAHVLLWGTWLVVTGLVFSLAQGIIHPYYTVALAPAIAALVGLGVAELWRWRAVEGARWGLASLIAVDALWTFVLAGRASWHPALRWLVLLLAAVAVIALVGLRARAVIVGVPLAAALLLLPTAYSLQTAATGHTGALPSAGPATTTGFGIGGAHDLSHDSDAGRAGRDA